MAPSSSRVQSIELLVREPIERHGGASGKDHAKQDPDQVNPVESMILPGKCRAQEGERQREEGMAKPDHLEQHADALEHGFELLRSARNPGVFLTCNGIHARPLLRLLYRRHELDESSRAVFALACF